MTMKAPELAGFGAFFRPFTHFFTRQKESGYSFLL